MTHRRLVLLAFGLSALLAGCAGQPHRKPAAGAGAIGRPGVTQHQAPALPSRTGIAACDDYLASYRACHRAAGIFAPDQVEPRYREMRQSLLRDSIDPHIRPQLATRCNALARSMREALHGRSCQAIPEPPSGSGD